MKQKQESSILRGIATMKTVGDDIHNCGLLNRDGRKDLEKVLIHDRGGCLIRICAHETDRKDRPKNLGGGARGPDEQVTAHPEKTQQIRGDLVDINDLLKLCWCQ